MNAFDTVFGLLVLGLLVVMTGVVVYAQHLARLAFDMRIQPDESEFLEEEDAVSEAVIQFQILFKFEFEGSVFAVTRCVKDDIPNGVPDYVLFRLKEEGVAELVEEGPLKTRLCEFLQQLSSETGEAA